ncbi:hypothetical protein [Maritimibacter dapengensis]|uniref:Uncharacterized protein n=1 Tax=Maritimibacter dapengensis TaxID=2836868 RepID=A0ABS6SWU1_9RHOB|nr:hypothetical protein [Maritimibacter dapengensis]MBV7377434.1 hypothetical protein [Maritimibacter dapengensis]
MAQVLSIVGESGIHGMDHNGIIGKVMDRGRKYQSNRFRISVMSAHRFSEDEFEDYLILAWRFGLVTRSRYQEIEFLPEKDKSAYHLEDEVVCLTREGWEFVEEHYKPLLHRWWANIIENIPTIVTSIAAFVLGRILLQQIGILP